MISAMQKNTLQKFLTSTFQNAACAFKKTFEMQTLKCLFTQQNNVAKIRSRVKGYLFYNHKYALCEEPECLREPEQQHSKHAHSKNNQRTKIIGYISDTLIKVGHQLILGWKVFQAMRNKEAHQKRYGCLLIALTSPAFIFCIG